LDARLLVDGKEVLLNDFVNRILCGMIVGAVTSLRDVNEDWRKIEIKITK
jgi:hypothetical protein